jgi:hypothetical protein
MRYLLSALVICLSVGLAAAQSDPLTIEASDLITQTDVFGVEQQVAVGQLTNTSDNAYLDVQIFAGAFNEDGEQVGEGIGVLTNQCGKNVPLDFALQPDATQRFVVSLELYETDAEIDRIEYAPNGRPVEAMSADENGPIDGITPVSNREVAGLEWNTTPVTDEDDTDDDEEIEVEPRLLFGQGCYRDVFTTYQWFAYDAEEDSVAEVDHPRLDEALNPDFRENMDMQSQFTEDPFEFLFNRSFLSFPPDGGNRVVFQTDINILITTDFDGGFRRPIDENLFRSTLQGINWFPDGRFMAYYYGAYGDGVTYLVANTAAAYFSSTERNSTPSVTVPGVSPDISAVVISGTFQSGGEEVTGFYRKPPASSLLSLLFEWENLPGNNYPAPIIRQRPGPNNDVIYLALPDAEDNDGPHLYCYDTLTDDLTELAPLPFELGTEDRAYMVMSPDETQIALGANGVGGGVWLLDLNAFSACTPDADA